VASKAFFRPSEREGLRASRRSRALLIAADAFKRAGNPNPKALVDAIRTTNITDNISMGPGIQFNDKGQNDKLKNGAIQNRAGKFAIIGPKAQSDSTPELPMTPYDKRG
jgi:branched-chain amino acid transport system substrate-binding protein